MEFFSDSSNIQIKSSETFNSSQLNQSLIFKYNNITLEQINKKSFYMIECNINLNNYYLINNVKINLENNQINNINQSDINAENEKNNNINSNIINDIILVNILFLYSDYYNNNEEICHDGKYDAPYYYNPDKEDIIINKNNELSIFCIGATNHISFRFLIKKKIKLEDITKNKRYICKYIIYSQYIYSIPNATFLMTLLNLKNFFYNLKNKKELTKSSNDKIKICNNYYCSMYLTAVSMIQARLFIQAWEMLTILQTEILSFNHNILEKNKFLKIMFEVNNKEKNNYPVKKVYLTKLELIKAICMFEHGHTQIFLDCLKNSIDIFCNNKYNFLGGNICLNKVNEIAQDKIYIQGLLSRYGNKIVDILINFLKDKNEMILYTVLKIIEFFLDYNPIITFGSIHKIIKFISKVSYDINKNSQTIDNNNEQGNYNNNFSKDYLIMEDFEENNINNDSNINDNSSIINENNLLEKIMKEKGILFPYDLYNNYKKETKKNNKNKDEKNDEESIDINKIYKVNSISPVLQKQINYTSDTIIQNISNFDTNVINNILITCSPFLFSIIKTSPKESLIYICSLKILKKCYINNSSNLYYMNYRNILNLFFFGIKSNLKDIFKEYIKIQKNIYKNKNDLHTTKKIKENLQNINLKNNYINSLLNTNGIIENNEYGNLITIIFDRISEIFVNDFSVQNSSKNKKNLYNGIDYIKNCVIYIKTCLEIIKNPEQNNNNIDSDFLIFYIYLILEFIIIIYLPNNKNEIKKNLLSFYLGKDSKFKSLLFENIEELIAVLFNLEEYTLTNLSSYLLFEPTLDILSRIKYIYKTNNINISNNNNIKIKYPSYDTYFLPQYELLYNFISKNGITHDNIKYLLKTLPLTDFENEKFIFYFQKILGIFLTNFDNYYTEESFNLFSLSLEKISNFINEDLFEKITTAILNKSNYKGKIFNQCYNKYNEIILKSEKGKNFETMIEQFNKAIIDYKNEIIKNKGNKILFKAKYIKFIDRIELIRKFYEYIKNNINEKNEKDMWKFSIFSQENLIKNIIDIISISDDTTTRKINLLFLENLMCYDYKNNKIINNKEIEEENNCNDNKEQEDIEDNKDKNNLNNINNINENKNKEKMNYENNCETYSVEHIQFLKNIIINNDNINEFLLKINSKDNLYLLNENLKLMNKIVQIINYIGTEYITIKEKCLLFTKYYSSINKKNVSNLIKIPNLLDDLFLFYYQIIIPITFNEITQYEEYLFFINEIFLWCFNLDEKKNKNNNYIMSMLGIEIMLKFFDIKLNIKDISILKKINNNNNYQDSNIFHLTKEEIIEQKNYINNINLSIFESFFEELIKSLDSVDYQIFFLFEYILNIIIPKDMKEKMNKIIENLNINEIWLEDNDKLYEFYIFINEKVISNKIINNQNTETNSDFIGINLDEDNEKDDFIEKDIIVDEVTDEDNDIENDNDIDFPEIKNEDTNIIQQENKNNFNDNNINIKQINNINNIDNIDGQELLNNLINNGNINPELLNLIIPNNNINNNNNNFIINNNQNNIYDHQENNNINNLDKNDDDISLEDLGVKEVDDDIFGENFDESKVPILKKNNVRCKGYAAKFKTNQNSRALLMSEHVRESNSKNSNNDNNNNLNIDNNNINNINSNINKINNSSNHSMENENNNIQLIKTKNLSEKEKTESDFNDAPDLTQKKKNIRPLNGFRPATPPLKDAFTQQNSSSNQNFNNIFNINNNHNIIENKEASNKKNNKIESTKSSHFISNSINNKKMKEKGKISNTKKQHNKGSKYGKKKDKKIGGKDSRAKSYEIYKNIRYQIKGVELFLRKNKKNKKKMKSKNDVSGNTVNKKIINNQKDNLDKKTNEDIKLESNIQIKLNKEKEKILEDEDDIIFNDILNLDDNENNNKNNQKIKFYQRPNDKKKIDSKSQNIK